MKKAFTLIELIIVIVALGILSAIGADIISKAYENYLYNKAIANLEFETEELLNSIGKRLNQRVWYATILREKDNFNNIYFPSQILTDPDKDYIIEWYGIDFDSFRGMYDDNKSLNIPGWSGFIDLDSPDTNKTQVKTPGGNLEFANKIISVLSFNDVNMSDDTKEKPVIMYREIPEDFNLTKFGWDYTYFDRNLTEPVKCPSSGCKDILEFVDSNKSRVVYEQYYLCWSAFAIEPDNNKLYLYYNYRPWYGDKFSDGNRTLLTDRLSRWKIKQKGKVINLKLCLYKKLSDDYNITVCKQKAIY